MAQNKNIVVVIPVFNEENSIQDVVIKTFEYSKSIIVVDDGSTDSTKSILDSLNNTYPENLIVISNDKNYGIGKSMKIGFKKAISLDPEIIFKIDGDGQHNPDDIPKFINQLIKGNYDLVKGNRFMDLKSLESMPKIKLLGNLLITSLQKIISGNYYISDPNNGFLAINASTLKLINFKYLNNLYFFENSLLIVFSSHKFKIGEIGIKTIYKLEKSSIPIFKAFVKTLPVFIKFLFIKNYISATKKVSLNALIFYSGILIFLLNIILNILNLWILLVILIILYLFIDILNHTFIN